MIIPFIKYHGSGNDFILIDNRKYEIDLTKNQISLLCNRHMGIGADGLIYILPDDKFDFRMKYFNADGGEGTMCGNGGRCIVGFAYHLGLIKSHGSFIAIDGEHFGKVIGDIGNELQVEISLNEVTVNEQPEDYYFIDTGSPHYVQFVKNLKEIDTFSEGKKIRWDERFQPEGCNVNFSEYENGILKVKTFERGVENTTLSCGTGVTAAAVAASMEFNDKRNDYNIETLGGKLKISFTRSGNHFSKIKLKGPVVKVFEGEISI